MKTLIITLVIGLASMANASLQISVMGDTDPTESEYFVPPGDETFLGIWTSTNIPLFTGGYWALVVNTDVAYIDYTTGVVISTDPGFWLEHSMSAVDMGFTLPPGQNGIGGQAFDLDLPDTAAGSLLFDLIIFHSVGLYPYDAVVRLYETPDGVEMTLVDSTIIHIPEPTTVALLGLGGLFLRRRR